MGCGDFSRRVRGDHLGVVHHIEGGGLENGFVDEYLDADAQAIDAERDNGDDDELLTDIGGVHCLPYSVFGTPAGPS